MQQRAGIKPSKAPADAPSVAAISLIGFGSFVLASLVVGVRLLLLARSTRQVPEAALGAALFFGGGVGYLLMILALDVLPRSLAPPALVAANLSLHVGASFLAIGTARIFRAGDSLGRFVVATIVSVLVVSDVLRLLDPTRIPPAPAVFWTASLGSAAAYLWSAIEAGRYATSLRRRVRLELAEPAVARRIALWATACAAAVVMHAAAIVNRLAGAEGMHPAALAVSSAFGLAAAACLWRAFSQQTARREPSSAERSGRAGNGSRGRGADGDHDLLM